MTLFLWLSIVSRRIDDFLRKKKSLERQAYNVVRNRSIDVIHDIERLIRAIMQATQTCRLLDACVRKRMATMCSLKSKRKVRQVTRHSEFVEGGSRHG